MIIIIMAHECKRRLSGGNYWRGREKGEATGV
jgi:hypothetical protein